MKFRRDKHESAPSEGANSCLSLLNFMRLSASHINGYMLRVANQPKQLNLRLASRIALLYVSFSPRLAPFTAFTLGTLVAKSPQRVQSAIVPCFEDRGSRMSRFIASMGPEEQREAEKRALGSGG